MEHGSGNPDSSTGHTPLSLAVPAPAPTNPLLLGVRTQDLGHGAKLN